MQILLACFSISSYQLCIYRQVADVYRSKLRDDLQGVEGDEVLRRRVEDFINLMRPSGILVSIFLSSFFPRRQTRNMSSQGPDTGSLRVPRCLRASSF